MRKFFLILIIVCFVLCSFTSCAQADSNEKLLLKIESLEEQISGYEYEISELNRVNELKLDDLNVEIDMLVAERVELTDKIVFVDNTTNTYHHYYHACDIYDLSEADVNDKYTILELQEAQGNANYSLCSECKEYFEY